MAKYTIFGGGPGGLYTAWRLLTCGELTASDSVELYEWGNYDYEGNGDGDRAPAGRICSYHYKQDPSQSYIEVGGMRFIDWDSCSHTGHQLVSLTINAVGLRGDVIEFNTTDNPLFYLRNKHFYQQDLGTEIDGVKVIAPYNTPGNNEKPADELVSNISALITGEYPVKTRIDQCHFYESGTLSSHFDEGSYVYKSRENIGTIGYWNMFYDQAGDEGFQYAADAGGYSSNVINWNAANAAVYNGEFTPGGKFKTLSKGYSSLFVELFKQCLIEAGKKSINFNLIKKIRLHSIWIDKNSQPETKFHIGASDNPDKPSHEVYSTDYAFLAMPPNALELVACATRYQNHGDNIVDFLNAVSVQNYLQSVIEQPSYKVAMFFDTEWWKDGSVVYPPKLVNKTNKNVNVFGPTITDLPLRQVYYFGDNGPGDIGKEDKVYGVLTSYDDMRFTKFWEEMELPVDAWRETPLSHDYQPLHGAGEATFTMMRMLKLQLAKVHYGDPNSAGLIPDPLETVYMDWGLNPFGAGYHAWAAHYNICDVMQKIRTPGRMAGVEDSNIFLVGSAFSNDQAWVEGAFCTVESVLIDYLGIPTIAENKTDYPLICGGDKTVRQSA